MELSDNDIDKLFKDNLSDLNVTFNPKDWNNMQQKIINKKKRKFFLFGGLLLVVAIFVCSYLFVNWGKSENVTNAFNSKNSTKTVANNTSLKSNKNSVHNINKANTSNEISQSQINKSDVLFNENKGYLIKENAKSNGLKRVYEKEKSIKQAGVKNVDKKGIEKLREANGIVDSENRMSKNEQNTRSNNSLLENSFTEDNATSLTVDKLLEVKKRESLVVFNSSVLDKHENECYIDSSFTRYPNLLDSSKWISAYAIEFYPNNSMKRSSGDFQLATSNVTSVFGFGLAVNSTIKRTKKWDFNLGIGYTNIGYNTNYVQEITTEIFNEVSERYSYNFVDVQVGVNYYFIRKRFSFYLNATPEINFFLLGKKQITNKLDNPFNIAYEVQENEKKSLEANKIMSAINIGVGLDYQLNENWNVYAQPNYKQSLVSYNSVGFIKQTPYSLGIKFGLRYNIYNDK